MHSLRAGIIEAQLPNGRMLRLHAAPRDIVASAVWWGGWDAYEPEASRLWCRYAAKSSCVLDIGANIGLYAILAGLVNQTATIIAFEPVPATCRSLETNVAANNVSVTCVQKAVTDMVGEVALATDLSSRNDGGATLASNHPTRRASDPGVGVLDCCTTTIDEFTADNGLAAVDLVKIDTELAEPLVLAGMQRVLGANRPTIFIEVLNDQVAAAVEAVAATHKYQRFVLTGGGPIQTDRVRAHKAFKNYLLSSDPPDTADPA